MSFLARTGLAVLLVLSLSFITLSPPTSLADTFRPVVRGKRGVVAGGQPLSVEAGLRVLQHGGNAVDLDVASDPVALVVGAHFEHGGLDLLAHDHAFGGKVRDIHVDGIAR